MRPPPLLLASPPPIAGRRRHLLRFLSHLFSQSRPIPFPSLEHFAPSPTAPATSGLGFAATGTSGRRAPVPPVTSVAASSLHGCQAPRHSTITPSHPFPFVASLSLKEQAKVDSYTTYTRQGALPGYLCDVADHLCVPHPGPPLAPRSKAIAAEGGQPSAVIASTSSPLVTGVQGSAVRRPGD